MRKPKHQEMPPLILAPPSTHPSQFLYQPPSWAIGILRNDPSGQRRPRRKPGKSLIAAKEPLHSEWPYSSSHPTTLPISQPPLLLLTSPHQDSFFILCNSYQAKISASFCFKNRGLNCGPGGMKVRMTSQAGHREDVSMVPQSSHSCPNQWAARPPETNKTLSTKT